MVGLDTTAAPMSEEQTAPRVHELPRAHDGWRIAIASLRAAGLDAEGAAALLESSGWPSPSALRRATAYVHLRRAAGLPLTAPDGGG